MLSTHILSSNNRTKFIHSLLLLPRVLLVSMQRLDFLVAMAYLTAMKSHYISKLKQTTTKKTIWPREEIKERISLRIGKTATGMSSQALYKFERLHRIF